MMGKHAFLHLHHLYTWKLPPKLQRRLQFPVPSEFSPGTLLSVTVVLRSWRRHLFPSITTGRVTHQRDLSRQPVSRRIAPTSHCEHRPVASMTWYFLS